MSSSIKKNISIRKNNDSISNRQDFSLSLNDKHMKNFPHQSHVEKKGFDEQLWHMGKVVGKVKGFFKLSNLPVVQ